MPGRTAHRRRRNRHPRPGLIVNPPAQLTINAAVIDSDPKNGCVIQLDGTASVQSRIGGGIWDYTENEECIFISAGTQAGKTNFAVVFPTTVNREGHIVGWDAVPPNMNAAQLGIAEGARSAIYIGFLPL